MSIPERYIAKAVLRTATATILGLIILALGAQIMYLVGISPTSMQAKPWLGSSIMHTTMLVFSILIALVLGKGKISTYGFCVTKTIPFPRVILVGFGLGIGTSLVLYFLQSGQVPFLEGFSFVNQVIFIWIYASICEEALTRGLIQSYLAPLRNRGFSISRLRISYPVIIGALFFALMHLMPFGGVLPILHLIAFLISATILGIAAGYYREKTGSLIPAVIVHMLFNVSGSLVDFLFGLFR